MSLRVPISFSFYFFLFFPWEMNNVANYVFGSSLPLKCHYSLPSPPIPLSSLLHDVMTVFFY